MTRMLVPSTGPNRTARAAIRAEERRLRRDGSPGAIAAALYRLRKLGIAAHVPEIPAPKEPA